MSIDDEYAAIGIDLRALRREATTDLAAPAPNPVELKLGRAILRPRLYPGWSQLVLEERSGELMLRGDPSERAKREADGRLNRRRTA